MHSGAWAITEPDLGSDIYRPNAALVRARPTPGNGGFIINGAKSSWCSNGWLADMLCVMINVEPAAGMDGTGVFLIPADWPGISRGRPISKVGLRALNQCDTRFDDVEVPKEFMIIAPGPRYRHTLDRGVLAPGNTAVGLAVLGIAHTAARIGFDYARTRHQGAVTPLPNTSSSPNDCSTPPDRAERTATVASLSLEPQPRRRERQRHGSLAVAVAIRRQCQPALTPDSIHSGFAELILLPKLINCGTPSASG